MSITIGVLETIADIQRWWGRRRVLRQTVREIQAAAEYPYCEHGWSHCRSQSCGCVDSSYYRAAFRSAVTRRLIDDNTP